jgi:hypothetical protein
MGRTKSAIILVLGICVSMFAYAYFSSDEHERACGLANLFRTNYSDEVVHGVELSQKESDINLDLRRLERWKTACVASLYVDEFHFAPYSKIPSLSFRVGKSQCNSSRLPYGDPDKLALLLARDDSGFIVRMINVRVLAKNTIIETSYSFLEMPKGFRQCSQISSAVARCSWTYVNGQKRCRLMFPMT